MRTRGRAGTLIALAAACAGVLANAPAASARDATVRSFDGTPLITHFFPAEGLKPGQKAPTVLLGHGYGMTGETDPNSKSDTLFGQVGAGPLRRAGFNVLSWDARGFGGSGGQVEVDSPSFEGRDVRELITHIAKQPEARLDAPGDPRVGMNGVSYGGGIQLVTAAIDTRVDTITPTISWNSLVSSLYKEGIVKQGWGTVLTGAGGTSITNGILSPAGPQTGSTDPQVTKAAAEGVGTGRFSQGSVDFFRSRGPAGLVARIRIPTLLVQGTADTLFTLKESMVNHAILKRNGVPLKMIWFCGGHGVCLTGKGDEGHVEHTVVAWLRRYLARDRSVRTGRPFEWLAQDGVWRSGVRFPLVQKGSMGATGSGRLALSPSSNSTSPGAFIAATPSPDALNVSIPAPRRASDVVGEPALSLTYSGTGAPAGTHVFAQVVDGSTGRVLGNQVRPIPVTLDGKRHTIRRPLEALAARAGPGSNFRLQIAPATTVYASQRTTGLIDFSRVAVRLPIVDPNAFPKRRLLVGPNKGMRRARRGRPFRLRVRAKGGTLRRVRVVVRNRRGRIVGRSKRFTLGSRRKRVRIRVRRRLPAGRYRFRAVGRDEDARLIKGTKRIRVKRRHPHHRR